MVTSGHKWSHGHRVSSLPSSARGASTAWHASCAMPRKGALLATCITCRIRIRIRLTFVYTERLCAFARQSNGHPPPAVSRDLAES